MLETIAAAYSGFIGSISNYLYTYILIVLLVAGGIYFTVRTKFVQFRFLPESIRIVMQPSEDQNSISAFKTLMVSTASRVGTGNIAGISTAICLGGTMQLTVVWDTADVLMGLMALINVPVIVLLLKPALRCLDDYIQQKKSGKNPEFKASSIGLKEKVDFWN